MSTPTLAGETAHYHFLRDRIRGLLVNINLKDIDFREKLVRVTGKRRKQRIVPFGTRLQALMHYLHQSRPVF
jgi:site-specific recombinase XerD